MGVILTNIEQKVKNIDIIISRLNDKGNITYANPIFFRLSGYTPQDFLENPQTIIDYHPDMPQIIFKYLTDNLQAGLDVKVFVKNLSRDGSFYWVFEHIIVEKNSDKSFKNYISIKRHMSSYARSLIEPLYKKLVSVERKIGESASKRMLEAFLEKNHASFATFNDTMQKIQNSV